MGNDTIGLYIKGFNLYGNVVESEFKTAVKAANRRRELQGYVWCSDIFGRGESKNFHCNYELWSELTDYVATQVISIDDVTWDGRKVLVLQFGQYVHENIYWPDNEF